ncbi:hypothetical protein FJ964_23165 [Mesorhizobium sp. B2-3-2]|nr:hypothetical protein FJ964_23165 [Mesorhizobium sp. B2-3-2]
MHGAFVCRAESEEVRSAPELRPSIAWSLPALNLSAWHTGIKGGRSGSFVGKYPSGLLDRKPTRSTVATGAGPALAAHSNDAKDRGCRGQSRNAGYHDRKRIRRELITTHGNSRNTRIYRVFMGACFERGWIARASNL